MKNYNAPTNQQFGNPPSAGTVIRFIGVGIVLFGLVLGLQVIQVAWDLFDDQKIVVTLSEKINEQSNLDKVLPSIIEFKNFQRELTKNAHSAVLGETNPKFQDTEIQKESAVKEEAQNFRASYFAAWIITLMLLALIAKISIWAMTAGGKMALYGVEQHRELKKLFERVVIR